MSVSEKTMNDPNFDVAAREANQVLQGFANSLGLKTDDLQRVASDSRLGQIVDDLTTVGVRALRDRGEQ